MKRFCDLQPADKVYFLRYINFGLEDYLVEKVETECNECAKSFYLDKSISHLKNKVTIFRSQLEKKRTEIMGGMLYSSRDLAIEDFKIFERRLMDSYLEDFESDDSDEMIQKILKFEESMKRIHENI